MSLLASGIETHPTGTFDKNPIINGNWGVIDAALVGKTESFTSTVTADARNRSTAVVVTANVVVAVSNKISGRETRIILTGSGGPWTITWPSGAKWEGGPPPSNIVNGQRIAVSVYCGGTANSDLVFRIAYDRPLQNVKSANYTCILDDAGSSIHHPAADTTARDFTIPSNAAVPYNIGESLTFTNEDGAGIVTIKINTDTLRLAGAGTTGDRTLAPDGIATAIKITATKWLIYGTGLT